jgi:hypothetical protein
MHAESVLLLRSATVKFVWLLLPYYSRYRGALSVLIKSTKMRRFASLSNAIAGGTFTTLIYSPSYIRMAVIANMNMPRIIIFLEKTAVGNCTLPDKMPNDLNLVLDSTTVLNLID